MKNQFVEIRVGIVGCGNIANQHISALRKIHGVTIVGVCDIELHRAKQFAKKYSIDYFTDNIESLISKSYPHSIHILSPAFTHVSIAKHALLNKCHVFIEKPLFNSIDEYDELNKVLIESGKFLSVNHSLLEDPIYKYAKEKIEKEEIGEIIHIDYLLTDDFLKKYHSGVSRPWITTQKLGVFHDLLPHPIYILQDLLGDISITNVKAIWDNKPFPIYLKIDFISRNNSTASIMLSLKIFPIQQKIIVYGDDGSVTADYRNFTNILDKNKQLPQPLPRIIGNLSKSNQYFIQTFKNYTRLFSGKIHPYKGLRSTIEYFYKSIKESTPPNVQIIHGKKVIEVMSAIEEKVQEKNSINIKDHDKKGKAKALKAAILVSGATGNLGKTIVRRLVDDGNIVRVICRESSDISSLQDKNIEIFLSDIRDIDKNDKIFNGISTVIHCASAMRGNWFDHYEITIDGTKKILDQCITNKIKKFIHISSLGILNYAKVSNGSLIDENSELEEFPDKRGYYTKAKLLQENIVKEYINTSKLDITIIRPGIIINPDIPTMISDIGFKFKKIFIHLGFRKRNLRIVNVNKVTDDVIKCLNSNRVSGEIYNSLNSSIIDSIQYINTYNKDIKPSLIIRIPNFIVLILFGIIDLLISYLPGQEKRHLIYKLKLMMKSFDYKVDKLNFDLD
jgi:2-alkyl-3-oxoalkanoate reductase